MDYAQIMADPVRGPEIGRLYMDASPFVTTLAEIAYRRFAEEVERQFHDLVWHEGVRVIFQEEDPYEDAWDMFEDVSCRQLKIWATHDDHHPLLSAEQNNMFRAVHDYHGHYRTARDFSRHGEEAAWVRHSQMFSGLARRAMTTETRGQSSAFVWVNGGTVFPEQKAVLLPDWVSEIPAQWR